MLTQKQIHREVRALHQLMALPSVPQPKENLRTLAEDAADILGYNVLLHKHSVGRLTRALLKLEIEVIPMADVLAYQQKMGQPHHDLIAMIGDEVVELDDDEDDEESDDDDEVSDKAWNRTEISHYHKPVPEHVINKAVQLKRELPNVNLFIEELGDRRVKDPFMVARLGKEQFYIEVWEEPKFEGRLQHVTTTNRKERD